MAFVKERDYFKLNLSSTRLVEDDGYQYFYMPEHPLATQNSLVPLHRHIKSVQVKRWIGPDEVVIFVNGNRQDMTAENLLLATRADLMKMVSHRPSKVQLICPYCIAHENVMWRLRVDLKFLQRS